MCENWRQRNDRTTLDFVIAPPAIPLGMSSKGVSAVKPLALVLGAAFIGGVALYGKNQKMFWVFQAVMLPVFLWFFGVDVMLGKGEISSSLWFLPFLLVWIVGTVALGLWTLRHIWKEVRP